MCRSAASPYIRSLVGANCNKIIRTVLETRTTEVVPRWALGIVCFSWIGHKSILGHQDIHQLNTVSCGFGSMFVYPYALVA